MPNSIRFHYLEPTFFAGLLDDPVLVVRIRPLGRSLMIDCGQIHHLAKRVIKSLDAIFITHAHMDHFMGIDTVVRHLHVSPRILDVFGPPGLADKLAHKLAGYDWNLHEDFWCSFRVHEIFPDRLEQYLFAGPSAFSLQHHGTVLRSERVVYRNRYLRVEAEVFDHKIPVLAYRITERTAFAIDPEKLREAGLATGPWLQELQRRICRGTDGGAPLIPSLRDGMVPMPPPYPDAASLYEELRRDDPAPSLGYVTDIGMTDGNLRRLEDFLAQTHLLLCECAYLKDNREKARAAYHLCTEDLNALLPRLRPSLVLPCHLSKTYLNRTYELYEELELPAGVELVRLPVHLTPRPLLPDEAGALKAALRRGGRFRPSCSGDSDEAGEGRRKRGSQGNTGRTP